MAVSPDGRCALIRLNSGNWAVLPFNGEEDENAKRDSVVLGNKAVAERLQLAHIHDFVFLDGFFEPTVAVLYESGHPNFPSQHAIRKDTTEILVLTLSLRAGKAANEIVFTPLFHRSGMPSECRRLNSVGKPVGGLLVCGPNLFLHLDPATGSLVACPLNNFAHISSPSIAPTTSHRLTASKHMAVLPGGSSAIWSTTEGSWYWLRLVSGGRGVASMIVEQIAQEGLCFPHGFTLLKGNLLFAAALNGAHRLFTVPHGDVSVNEDTDLYGQEEADLYGSSSGQASAAPSNRSFDLISSIPSIGPVSDFVLAPTSDDPTRFEVVVGGSHGPAAGHITRICTSIPFNQQSSFALDGAERLNVFPGFLAVSTAASTVLLGREAHGFIDIEQTAFTLNSKTILAASLIDGKVLQVTKTGFQILSSDLNSVISSQACEVADAISSCGFLFILSPSGLVQIHDCESGQMMALDLTSVQQISACEYSGSCALSLLQSDGSLSLLNVNRVAGCQPVLRTACAAFLPQVILNGSSVPEGIAERFEIKSAYLLSTPNDLFLVITSGSGLLTTYRWSAVCMGLVKMNTHQINGFESAGDWTKFNAGSVNGVTLGGRLMIVIGDLGYPRMHPLRTHFKSLCHLEGNGFIGIDTHSQHVLILSIDTGMVLDTPTPFRPYHLASPVHRLVACPRAPTGTFTAVTGKQLTSGFVFPDDDYSNIADNKEWRAPATLSDPEAQLPPPRAQRYSLALLSLPSDMSSNELETLDSYELDEYEQPVELCLANLKTKETSSGRKTFTCLGVAINKGEDRPVHSRVLIFDTAELVGEQDEDKATANVSTTVRRFKLLVSHLIKMGLSAMTPIAGHLALTTGYKTIIYEFEDNDALTGIAFVDSGVYQTASIALKNFLWLGDASGRGIGLYAFQERPPKLVELGRALDPEVLGRPILVAGCTVSASGQLLAVSADDTGRLSLHSYAPTSLASLNGTRLRFDGEWETGLQGPIIRLAPLALSNASIALLWMSTDGATGILHPLPDTDDSTCAKSLSEAQARAIALLPHPAGLHPREMRGAPAARMILDGDLMGRLQGLPSLTRERVVGHEALEHFSHIRHILYQRLA